VVPGLKSEKPSREPKRRGDVWTEEREARNERRATREGIAVKGDGEVGGAAEASGTTQNERLSDAGRRRLKAPPEASGTIQFTRG
jgi:hypothetical protein